ncbi:MAG: hypothetical protein NC307_15775 [Roseburia sp.]|nr:hypothetical protein [Roseburia sp.]
MSEFVTRYPPAEPGCGLTVFSMEGGEITLFGSCVKIKTTGQDSYDTIEDAPESRPVVDQAAKNLCKGLTVSAFFAVIGSVALFGTTIVTGGAALFLLGGACIAGGASVSTGTYSLFSFGKDKLTGAYTSASEFEAGLAESAVRGAELGAIVFGMITYPPSGTVIAQTAGSDTAVAVSTRAVDTLVSFIPQVVGAEAAAELLAQGGKALMSRSLDGGDVAGNEEEGVYIEDGNSVKPTKEGLDIIEKHLSGDMQADYNDAMIERIRNILKEGGELTGPDAEFYRHEIEETRLMNQGMDYNTAHGAALEKYGVTEFDLYHPDVIESMPEWFGSSWFDYWGISH